MKQGQIRDKIGSMLLAALFVLILGTFALLNIGSLKDLLMSADISFDDWQESAASIETSLKERTWGRERLIDLYGLSLKVFNRDLIGNFEFAKDSHDIIHLLETPGDSWGFIDEFQTSMMELRALSGEKGFALLYVSLPDRGKYFPLVNTDEYTDSERYSKIIGERLQNEGIDCLDVEMLMEEENDAPSFDEFFFRTDLHFTTYAEFWMAKKIVEHLQEELGMEFYMPDQVFSLQNYDVRSYEFLGNTARSAGALYAKADQFDIYTPLFETNIQMDDPTSGWSRTGDFGSAALNGYSGDGSARDKYIYWVTDYGIFARPYYEYINLNAPATAPHVLVVSDSTFMRGFSYLSLACGKVTVLDPRYFNGVTYLGNELALDDYDAVVFLGGSLRYFCSDFSAGTGALPELPEEAAVSGQEYGSWIGRNGMDVNSCNGEEISGDVIRLRNDASVLQLQGWGADFRSEKPFSSLFCQVGDIVMPCDYGSERRAVAATFKNDELVNTGFEISIPLSYLKNGTIGKLSFYGVNADGTKLCYIADYQIEFS